MATKRTTKKRPAARRERPEPRDRRDEREGERDERSERRGGGEGGRRSGGGGGGRNGSNLTRLGGAWKRETKKGEPMLAGRVNAGDLGDYLDNFGLKGDVQIPLLLLKNNYKESQKHPDFIIYGLDPEDVQRRSRGNRGGGGGGGRSSYRNRDDDRGERNDDNRERGDRNGGGDDLSLD